MRQRAHTGERGSAHLVFWTAVIAAVLLAAMAPRPASSAGLQRSGAEVRLVSSTEEAITLEVRLDPAQVIVRPISVDGQPYVEVSVSGWTATGEPGAPLLPFATAALGVPLGPVLSVHVEPGSVHLVQLDHDVVPESTVPLGAADERLPPGSELPTPQVRAERDEGIYGSPDPYPGELARVTGEGMLRQQRVAGIALYPVQYRPLTMQLEIYESLVVEIRMEGKRSPATAKPESRAMDDLLRRSLLNGESVGQWRGESGLGDGTLVTPWSPPEPGYKIWVEQEGMYKVTYGTLQAAGVPVDQVDPRTFRIQSAGSEVAIYVAGESDGHFDVTDYLLFYGSAIQSKYTRYNVYWLSYGQGLGLRMASRSGSPNGGTVPSHFQAALRLEENLFYVPILPGDESLERFLWAYIYPPGIPSWSRTVSLPAAYDGQGTATLRVAMFGYLSSSVNPDHHTRIYVNGHLVEDAWWDGIGWRTSEVEFAQSYLVAGDNVITVECPNDSGVGYDIVEIDWLALEYGSRFVAANDLLGFDYDTVGDWKHEIDGFSTDDLALFDITDSGAVQQIVGGMAVPSGSGYLLRFRDAISAPTRYLALGQAEYLDPVGVELDAPSNLRSAQNGADYVIITHPDFGAELAALRDYRASQGLRALEVDVRDVYDEFGFGVVGAEAIRAFLLYAYGSWQAPAPTYVLFVGDGHYDPKNYLGYGRTSYLPPYLAPVDPWLNETASDNRYVALTEGDAFPDMIAGRFPVNSTAEANAMVTKVLTYEQSPAQGDWRQQLLFVADNADDGGDFDGASDEAISCCVPDPYQAERVYYLVTHQTPVAARLDIIDGINAGKLIVNYVGHAATSTWASESLFSTADIGSLANATKLPIVLPMTCYDGYFINPHVSSGHSLGESFVRASGKGAAASWSPTGLGIASGHDLLDRGFLASVLLGGEVDLGGATMAGKLALWSAGLHLDLVDTYILFGDPALRINLLEADTGIEKSVEPQTPLLPDEPITYTLSVINQGPDLAFHVTVTDMVPGFVADPEVVFSSLDITLRPGTEFVWDVQNLAPGEGGTIVVRGRVDPSAGIGWFVNEAEIQSGNREVGALPNQASVQSQVVAGPPASVALTANPAQVPVGGSVATIQALVTDQWGNRVADGTLVTFASDLGTLNPLSGVTQNGVVSTLLTSGTVPGLATVEAEAGSAQGSVQVPFVPGPPASIETAAEPGEIPVGGATSIITATVRDAYGNLVKDGILVGFAASRGTVAPASVPTSNGVAQTTLTSGAQVGVSVVAAQAGSAEGQVAVLFVAGPPTALSLVAGAPSVPVNGQTGLVATVSDAWGNAVADGTPVAFATDLGSVNPASTTTLNGQAAATFLAGTVAGQASLVAVAGSASGGAVVAVLPGVPAQMSLTASPQSVPLNGTALLEAGVWDLYGNPVGDGTIVSFSTTLGDVDPLASGTTGGVATSTLHAPGEPGLAIVTAQAGVASDSVQVTIGEGAPTEMILTADPAQIVADGVSSSTVTALVVDAFGVPITETLLVSFVTTLGQVDPPSAWLVDGQAVTHLSGTQSGNATVTAQAGSVSGVVAVQLVAGPPDLIELTVTPAEVPVGSQALLVAWVSDAFGNSVADGTQVSFSATLGTVVPATAATLGGVAQSTFHGGWAAGQGTITATAGSAQDSDPVAVLPGQPAVVSLSADPPAITANGTDEALITADVQDAYGNAVADGSPVLFSTSRGTLNPLQVPTVNGQAQTTLTAGTVAGTAVVTGACGAAAGTVQVPLVPGPAQSLSLTAVPASIPADGQSQSSLVATVADAFGNAVADGTTVTFGTSLGSVSPTSAPTLGGQAQSVLTSGTVAGTATVSAVAGAASDTAAVAFEPGSAAVIGLVAESAEMVADGVSTSVVTATLADAFGNPVADGTIVHFDATLGSVVPISGTTEAGAVSTTFRAGLVVGVAQVGAWSGGAVGQVGINLTPGPLASLVLTADPDTILADHQSTSVVVTHALDAWGRGVVDGTPIWFWSTNGNIDPAAGHTLGGWFTNTLESGWTVGLATITAHNGPVQGTTSVDIVPGPPASVTLTADRSSLPTPWGSWVTYVDAVVEDPWGHRVADGVPVTFTASEGSVTPQVVTTVNGVARTWYTGVPIGDWGTVTGSLSPGLEGSVQIWLERRYRVHMPLVLRGAGH